MALPGDIGSPLFSLLELILPHEGAVLYLLMGPFLEGGVAGAKDDPPLRQCRGEILGDLDWIQIKIWHIIEIYFARV